MIMKDKNGVEIKVGNICADDDGSLVEVYQHDDEVLVHTFAVREDYFYKYCPPDPATDPKLEELGMTICLRQTGVASSLEVLDSVDSWILDFFNEN